MDEVLKLIPNSPKIIIWLSVAFVILAVANRFIGLTVLDYIAVVLFFAALILLTFKLVMQNK